jgi:hypothetical protein
VRGNPKPDTLLSIGHFIFEAGGWGMAVTHNACHKQRPIPPEAQLENEQENALYHWIQQTPTAIPI